VADQGPDGFELVPGAVTFTFQANWKLQLENCSDAYHFTSTHPSYIRILEQRQTANTGFAVKSVWESSDYWREDAQGVAGGSCFPHGHVLNWGIFGVTEALPLFEQAEALAERHGAAGATGCSTCATCRSFPICRSPKTRRASCASSARWHRT
jgi:benzoate/toluate 1,2-dioxygenase alpha subunit